jgi:hypothetical protein
VLSLEVSLKIDMNLVSKKYIVLALFFLISSVASSQIMLPAYHGVYAKQAVSSGGLNNALNFDGVNDYVSVNSSAALNITSNLSLSAWVYRNSSGKYDCIIGKDNYAGNNGYSLWIYDDDKLTLRFGNSRIYKSSTSIPSGTWVHVAGTFDGTNAKLYINGTLDSSYPASAPTSNSGGLYLGTPQDAVGNPLFNFSGTLEDIRIWNIALTQSAIQSSMNSELLGNEFGLVAYYNFNAGTAGGNNTGITTLTDNSGNNNNGTLTSFTLTGTSSNWVSHSILTADLILNLDASNTASYPGSGTVWTDLSSSSNNMSLVNGASYDPSNRSSIFFDGVNDYAGKSSAMNTGQNFTVSVWMYATLLGSTRTSLVANSYNYSSGNGWFFCTNAGGVPNSFFLSIGNDSPVKVSSANILTLNTWNYLTAVIRNGGQYIDLYKNGVLISGASTDFGARTITYNYANFSIGFRDPGGTLDPFKGNIGSTQIYNQALTAADILANYNATKGRYGF